ncbi:Beta-catenin-like protein 1 [Grifola frondosa]|uniref:Beta-catenin-like protein 1 n=1 Tax=Grifola frondosa TaxID=5627 RepID=A0A1C7M294_GRIFR|nr:Beta-catenin-like protein 1 [Grifola frondosa]
MDIDKLFKVPKLPAGSKKRRMPDNPTPDMLKRMRMDLSEDSSDPIRQTRTSEDKGKSRAVTVQDEDENMESANVEFAPGGDADYFAEEDEEGRFFGGGLTKEQKDILNIFDQAGGEDVREDLEELSLPGVRRLFTRFDRAVNKNQEQRSKYPDDPSKFIDSEADLDVAIKALLLLLKLPIHENADIVIDVVEVIHELTDEDVGNEAEEDEEEQGSREDALKMLIESLLDNSISELLVENLGRLNESEDSDRQGVFHILGIFEKYSDSTLIFLHNSLTYDENRGYAAELLSILLQNNRTNRLELSKQDGVETILKILSRYRRKDPIDADETEFMENVFDALCSALSEPEIKRQFLASEGVDLMVLMMKDKMQSRSRAIKVLDYAMSGPSGTAVVKHLLKLLVSKRCFRHSWARPPKNKKPTLRTPLPKMPRILLASCHPSSPIWHLTLLPEYVCWRIEKEIVDERKQMEAEGEEIGPEEEGLWYLRRLDGGLFTLQTVDYILAWIMMEDDGIRSHVQKLLDRKSQSLEDIVKTLKIYYNSIDEEEPSNQDNNADRSLSQREILQNLISFLEAC